MLSFFKTRKDLPLIEASNEKIRSIYKKYQWQVFLGLVLGYAMFYVVRMALGVVKKPMLDAGIVTTAELGLMGRRSSLPMPLVSFPMASCRIMPILAALCPSR